MLLTIAVSCRSSFLVSSSGLFDAAKWVGFFSPPSLLFLHNMMSWENLRCPWLENIHLFSLKAFSVHVKFAWRFSNPAAETSVWPRARIDPAYSVTNTLPFHLVHPGQKSRATPTSWNHFLRTLQLLVCITPKQLFIYSYLISQYRWEVRVLCLLEFPLILAQYFLNSRGSINKLISWLLQHTSRYWFISRKWFG